MFFQHSRMCILLVGSVPSNIRVLEVFNPRAAQRLKPQTALTLFVPQAQGCTLSCISPKDLAVFFSEMSERRVRERRKILTSPEKTLLVIIMGLM